MRLDIESAKRRARRTVAAEKKAAADYAAEAAAAQHKAAVDQNEAILAKATQAAMTQALVMLGLCRPGPAILFAAAMAATSTGSSSVRPPQFQSPSSYNTGDGRFSCATAEWSDPVLHIAGRQRDRAG